MGKGFLNTIESIVKVQVVVAEQVNIVSLDLSHRYVIFLLRVDKKLVRDIQFVPPPLHVEDMLVDF